VADAVFLEFSSNALVDLRTLQQANVDLWLGIVIGGGKVRSGYKTEMPLSFKPKSNRTSHFMKWRSIKNTSGPSSFYAPRANPYFVK
jgi:hypothetical protein